MKKVNFKIVFVVLVSFIGFSFSAKAQETQHEKEAREMGLPTSSQVVQQAMAKAQAEKAANDAIVQQQRDAEALKPKPQPTPVPTPAPTPNPSSGSKAVQQ